MAFTDSILQDLYALLKTKATYVGVLTNSTTEVAGGSYARVQTTWPTGAAGAGAGTAGTINIPAGTTITHMGLWLASTGGTPVAVQALPTALTYNANGTVIVAPTETVSNA